jgi:hypothetical protein
VATTLTHSCPAQHPTPPYGQNTTLRALHVAPKPLPRRVVHPVPSPSTATHEPHMVRIYKRALRIALCQHQCLLSESSKPPLLCLVTVSATLSVLNCLTHFPSSWAGPGASLELGASPRATRPQPSPPEIHHVVSAPMSFHLDVVPLPWSVSRANTLLHHRTMAHGCAPVDTFLSTCQPLHGSTRSASHAQCLATAPG